MPTKDRSPIFLIVLTVFGLLFPAVTGPHASRLAISGHAPPPPDAAAGDAPTAPSHSEGVSAQRCPGLLPAIPSCTEAWVGVLEDFFFPIPVDSTGVPPRPASSLLTPSTSPDGATTAMFVPQAADHHGVPPPPSLTPPNGLALQSASYPIVPATCRSLPALPAARFLIATFADPFASGLRVLFDRSLDVVVRAIEAQGYERDRYYSPWDTAGRQAAGSPSSARCAQELPGLFLFRPGPNAPEKTPPLVLVVVGETPTWGIHKRAFATALDLVAARHGDIGAEGPIRVLGPSFSGSSASLRVVIDDWQARHPDARFDIVTGTATSPSNRVYFPTEGVGAPVRFRQAIVPDDVLQQAFYRYLHDRLGLSSPCDGSPELAASAPCSLDHVAVMSEAGTAYGQSFAGRSGAAATGAGGRPRRVYSPELPLPFPLHVASVRAQYERTSGGPGSTASVAPPTALDPRLDDTTRRSDIPPILSPSTPVTEDLMLSRTIDAISDRGIQLVGIAATDPADVIFLAQHVRQHRPDIRLFVFDGDVLFTHPDLVAATGGTLLVTPYAVTPALRWGFALKADTDAFPASASTGTYVAARTLLTGDIARPDRNLAVWVSAIGANGAWPLAAIVDPAKYADTETTSPPPDSDRAAPGALESRPSPMRAPSPPPEWTVIALGILVFSAWVTAGFCVALVAPRHLWWLFRPYRAVCCEEPASLGKACAMGAAIGAVDAMALPIVWAYFRRGPALSAWSVSVFVFDCGVVLSATTLVASAIAWLLVLRDVWPSKWRAAAYVGSIAGPLVLLMVGLRQASGGEFEGPLFILRVGAPASYLSPLAPLLLVLGLFYLAAFSQLEAIAARRAWSLGREGHDEPSDWPKVLAWDPGKASELATALAACKGWSMASGAIAVLAWAVVFDIKPFSTLEGKNANLLFCCLFAGAAFVVASSFAWFVGAWKALHAHLRALNRHYDSTALKAAMRRLPAGLAALPGDSDQANEFLKLASWGDDNTVAADELVKLASWLDANRAAILGWPSGACLGAAKLWADGLDAGFAPLGALPAGATAAQRFEATFRARSGVLPILRTFWKEPSHRWPVPRNDSPKGAGTPETPHVENGAAAPRLERDAATWLAKAEELVAGHAAICIHPVVALLRLLLGLAVGTALLWALAIGSYMFQPARLLTTVVSVVLIAILLSALALFIDLDRDETLSALTKTEAKITWGSFLADALTWIVLPFLAFLSVQYPAVANSVASWLEPASRLAQ